MVFNQIEHLIKMTNDLYSKWLVLFNQAKHLIKMANDI
jgi:hypothetical protein